MYRKREVIEQLKWVYAALSGVCVAFFFTLLGSSELLKESVFLFVSTLFFAVSLPLFTAFTIAHIILIESDVSPEDYVPVLKTERVETVTKIAFFIIAIAFVSLIGHFSILALLVVLVATLYALNELRAFYDSVFKIEKIESPSGKKTK